MTETRSLSKVVEAANKAFTTGESIIGKKLETEP